MTARGLRSKHLGSLALIVPPIADLFWRRLTRGVGDASQSHSYALLLCIHDNRSAELSIQGAIT